MLVFLTNCISGNDKYEETMAENQRKTCWGCWEMLQDGTGQGGLIENRKSEQSPCRRPGMNQVINAWAEVSQEERTERQPERLEQSEE